MTTGGSSNEIVEKVKALSLGEKIIGIAGLLFLICLFLPWFEYDLGDFGSESKSGISGDTSFLGLLALLALIALVGLIIVKRFTTAMPALPQGVTHSRLELGLAGFIALMVVLKFILGESTGGFDADATYGLYLGVILAIAMVVGAVLMFMEESKGGAAA